MLNILLLLQSVPLEPIYLWPSSLVSLHVVADALMGGVYFFSLLVLIQAIRQRSEGFEIGPFWLLGVFALLCGTTHLIAIWVLWHPAYWLWVLLKTLTAGVAVCLAIALLPKLPQALNLSSPEQLLSLNQMLLREIAERQQTEAEIHRLSNRLALAVTSAEIGIWEWDISQNELIWDEQMYALYGISSGTFDNNYEAWARIVHPEDRSLAEAAIQQALQNEKDYDIEFRVVHPDGNIRYIKADGLVQRAIDGTPQCMMGINYDITTRKQTEAALRKAENRFRATFEQAAVGIAHISPQGQFLLLNQRFCAIAGYPQDELIKLTFQDITHPDDLETDLAYIEQVLAGDIQAYTLEKRYISQQGRVVWINLTVSLVHQADGSPDYFISVIEDISDRKRVEESLRLHERMVCSTQDHMAVVDRDYTYRMVNDIYAQTYERSPAETIGRSLPEVMGEELFSQVVKPQIDCSLAGEDVNYQRLVTNPQGQQQYLDVAYSPYREIDGAITGVVVSIRDITALHEAEVSLALQARRAEALLELPPLAEQLDETGFMQRGQELAEDLTGSQIAFIHFVNADQETIELVTWSRRTLNHYCTAVYDRHYPVSQAGIWADAMRQRQAVVCNNYASHPNPHGLPKGHAHLERFISVPVIENGQVVMITGVGNKATDYTNTDIETVQLISDLIWRIVQRHRSLATTRLLGAVVESSDDAIITKDFNGHITSWNRGAERLFGYTALEAIGRPAALLLPSDRLDEEPQIMDRLIQGELIDHFETVHLCKDGTAREVSVTLSPVRDEHDQVVGSSKIIRDITAQKAMEKALKTEIKERKRALKQLQLLTQRLAESNQELQDFAYVASHDLQEPLRKIQAFGDRLNTTCSTNLTEKGQDYLVRMLNAANRAQTLINDLLTFSRVTTKANPFTPTNLEKVLKGVLADLEVAIEQSGASLEVDPLPTIEADSLQMRQVLQNLISNALKFQQAGQAPAIQIRVNRYWRDDQELCELRVIDNGIGFDQKYTDRIFQPFQRLHGRQAYAGSGIGLAIAQKVARRHGGTLEAKSMPGQGATFILTLPVHQS